MWLDAGPVTAAGLVVAGKVTRSGVVGSRRLLHDDYRMRAPRARRLQIRAAALPRAGTTRHYDQMHPPTDPTGRLTAFGNQLIGVHLWLRDELARLQDDVDAYLDGHGQPPRSLQAHCLAFCGAISRHHTGEDTEAFGVLAEQFPDLRPVLEQLGHDHQVVAEILGRLEELLGGLDTTADPAAARGVRGELDGLAAILESHFGYEERRLVTVLNSADKADWERAQPEFLRTEAESDLDVQIDRNT